MRQTDQRPRVEVNLSEENARWNASVLNNYSRFITPRYEPNVDMEHIGALEAVSNSHYKSVKEYAEMLTNRSIWRRIRDFIFGPISFQKFCYG